MVKTRVFKPLCEHLNGLLLHVECLFKFALWLLCSAFFTDLHHVDSDIIDLDPESLSTCHYEWQMKEI
jgi:hypothetical protein